MQIDINYDNGLSDIANNIENNFAYCKVGFGQ